LKLTLIFGTMNLADFYIKNHETFKDPSFQLFLFLKFYRVR
jgi:hypothetical protein